MGAYQWSCKRTNGATDMERRIMGALDAAPDGLLVRALAGDLRTSRATVNHALRRLLARGWVCATPGGGLTANGRVPLVYRAVAGWHPEPAPPPPPVVRSHWSNARTDGLTPLEGRILAEIAASPEGLTGYALSRRLGTLAATVYMALYRLREQGQLTSEQTNYGKRILVAYRLAEQGG